MPAYSLEDYLSLPKPDTVWIWRGVIPRSGSAVLFGDPKVGKSILTLTLLDAIVNPAAKEFLGIPIDQHGPVLYLQLDTPRSLWMDYLTVVKSKEARKGVFTIDREMKDLPTQFDIRNREHMKWLREEVEKCEPILVVIDTIRRMHKGDENLSDVMSNVHDAFIWATQPAALLYLVHKRKPQQGEFGPGKARGSTALMGAVDALINMTKSHLRFEARSDVDEEIAIFQQDDGTFSLNNKEEEIAKFIAELDPKMTKAEVNQAIADHFGVSIRTAKRYRASAGRDM
jgi:RecA-family ATPase